LYSQTYTPDADGLFPWQNRGSAPNYTIESCDSPFTVPSNGPQFTIKEYRTDGGAAETYLEGNTHIVGFYEPGGAFLGLTDKQAKNQYIVTYTFYFLPPETGRYTFYFAGTGKVKLSIDTAVEVMYDGKTTSVADWVALDGLTSYCYSVNSGLNSTGYYMTAGTAYSIVIQYHKTGDEAGFVALFANNGNYRIPMPLMAGTANDSVTMLSYVELPDIASVNIDVADREASKLTFTVPLAASAASLRGYYYSSASDAYINPAANQTIKKKRLVRANIGYGNETTQAFVGHISDTEVIRTPEGSDLLKVTCSDFAERLNRTISIAYPDALDYWIAGYLSDNSPMSIVSGTTKPASFDYFELYKVIIVLLLRAGIDSTLLQGQFWSREDSSGAVVDSVPLIPDYAITLDGNIKYSGAISIGSEEQEFAWPGNTGEFISDVLFKILDNFGLTITFNPFNDGAPQILAPNAPELTIVGRQLDNFIVRPYTDFNTSFPSWWNIGSDYNYQKFLYFSSEDPGNRIVTDYAYVGVKLKNSSDYISLGGALSQRRQGWILVQKGSYYSFSAYIKNTSGNSTTARLYINTRQHPSADAGQFDYLHPWNRASLGTVTASSDWTRYSVIKQATQTEWINVILKMDHSLDSIYVDAICMKQEKTLTAYSEFSDNKEWKVKAATNALGGEYLETQSASATLDMVIAGSRFDIVTVLGPDGGAFDTSGVADDDVDTCSYTIYRSFDNAIIKSETGMNLFYPANFKESYPFLPNIINTSSFESGDVGDWGVKSVVNIWDAIATDIMAYDGTYSVLIAGTVAASSGIFYVSIPTVSGRTYALSLRYYVSSKTGSPTIQAGTSAGLTTLDNSLCVGSDRNDWSYGTIQFTASASTTELQIKTTGIVVMYVDAIQVEELYDAISPTSSLVAYYDGESATGSNETIFSVTTNTGGDPLKYDVYRIRISAKNASYTTRINAIRAYGINYSEAEDTFLTGEESEVPGTITRLSLTGSSSDVRNDCIVVGARTTTAVAGDSGNENGQGLANDFYFARTVAVDSLYDKTASNYVGFPYQTLIHEPELRSQNRAKHISYMLVKRYNTFSRSADYAMIGYPNMSMYACIALSDSYKSTISNTTNLWVTGYSHSLAPKMFLTDVKTTPFAPWQSYLPKARPFYFSSDTIIRNLELVDESNPNAVMGPATPYDPYDSEAGDFVRVRFDLAIDCHLKVEIRDYYTDTIVAILTDPENKNENEGYVKSEAGEILYRWDGVNSVDLGERTYNAINMVGADDMGDGWYSVEHSAAGAWYEDDDGYKYGKFYVVITAKELSNLSTYRYSSKDSAHEQYIYTYRGATTTYKTELLPLLNYNENYVDSQYKTFGPEGLGVHVEPITSGRSVYQVEVEAKLMSFHHMVIVSSQTTAAFPDPYSPSVDSDFTYHIATALVDASIGEPDIGVNFVWDKIVTNGKNLKVYDGVLRVESLYDLAGGDWGYLVDKMGESKDTSAYRLWRRGNEWGTSGTKTFYWCPAVRIVLKLKDKSGRLRKYLHYAFWKPAEFSDKISIKVKNESGYIDRLIKEDRWAGYGYSYKTYGEYAARPPVKNWFFWDKASNARYSEEEVGGYPNIAGLNGEVYLWFYEVGSESWT